MGYYSSVEYDIKVKPEKIEEFNKAVKEVFKGSVFEELRADKDGWLEYERGDYYRKHYDTDPFILFLKEYTGDGFVYFRGEDGEDWGYEVTNGKVFLLGLTWKRVGVEVK